MLNMTIGSSQEKSNNPEAEYITSPDLFIQHETEKQKTAEASPEPSSTSSPETDPDRPPPTHFDDILDGPAEDPEDSPAGTPAASAGIFSERDFIVFYASVFNLASVGTGYKSLAIDKDDEMAMEGLKAIYSIGYRHPKLRWLISPIGEDFKDGIVAFQFLGQKARGVAAEMAEKSADKKKEADIAEMPPADRQETQATNADFERRKSNATQVKL